MYPYPPWICTASSVAWTASRPLLSFAWAAVRVKLRPVSFSHAALCTSNLVASISVEMLASLAWIDWNFEIG